MKFIPKVGEPCLVKLQGMHEPVKVDIKFVGDEHIIFILDGIERCEYVKARSFKPIKTLAEIEHEELKDWLNDDSYIYQMTDTLLINNICNHLILGGYRKQQVKPLSRNYATRELRISDGFYNTLVELGFIIQGGDK